jgi:SAM-dependent methyltransferase
MYRIIDFAHKVLKDHLKDTDNAVDATCGNGFDTYFLAKHLSNGKVFAFDIQEIAIKNAKTLITQSKLANVYFFHANHTNIPSIITDPFQAVIFNLGYLPKGDKSITTSATSTITSVKHLLDYAVENPNLLIVLVVYVGHEEGKLESDLLLDFTKKLNNKEYLVTKFENFNRSNSPYVLTIKRI